ncbi:undecaprenyl-diphosphate phosphatase [Skermania piniformis]|uniref:Undecaprenyl-diphosphatase n=1 Tax=Skermania pinensis TaxID=39122 RepID=A0ABX8S6X9_9ACTN|nr:undecaprenyl-diphosphate phosphatase [Skermania piniformis]QXQ12320.1 undecaprenyl-diphosphate phosphatase [Skermania piniformis]
MSGLGYLEAIAVGALQGVTELFPVSSLGHAVLIPAIVGGQWATDLNVSRPESPYLAFIVGLHVATAAALLLFFRRDWVRIIGGFVSSLRHRRVETADERLAWLIVLATIPVGISGLALEHLFRTTLGKPAPAAAFLMLNGVVLYVGERLRRVADRQPVLVGADGGESGRTDPDRADARLSEMPLRDGIVIGCAQILALLPGISRSGVTMVAGLGRGLSHEDAARFSFLLATPVILAAGVLKIPDLFGPLGDGIHGQVMAGSVVAFGSAYLAVRFLTRYFHAHTLTPFAIYSVFAGVGALVWLGIH